MKSKINVLLKRCEAFITNELEWKDFWFALGFISFILGLILFLFSGILTAFIFSNQDETFLLMVASFICSCVGTALDGLSLIAE